MITGKRTFDGEDVTDSIVAVMSRDPSWQALPPTTPPALRKVLRRCLEKDRSKRLADIRDALFEIDEAIADPEWQAAASATAVVATSPRQKAGWLLTGAASVAAVVAMSALTGVWPRAGVPGGTADTPVASVLRTSVGLPADGPLALGSRRSPIGFDDPAVSLSPDGSLLA